MDLQTLRSYLTLSPFLGFLGLTVESVNFERQEVVMRMPMRPQLERGGGSGQFHGGPIAALIDTVGDFAVVAIVKGFVPTINLRVDYLRPATGSYLIGKAVVRRAGRTVGVVDIDVFDDQNRLCAVGRGCYGTTAG